MARSGIVPLIAVLLIGLAPRLWMLAAPPETLITNVPDDAFYYLQIARHVVAGEGPTFDGIHPTNGFHPLWLWLVQRLARSCASPWPLVRTTLALGIACSLCAAIALAAVMRRITPSWWIPPLVAAVYYWSPQTVWSSINGLETSVSTLCFVLALLATLRLLQAPSPPRRAETTLAGCLGFLLLARTDNVFFAAALVTVVVAFAPRSARLRRAVVVVGIPAFMVAPGLEWNWSQFGSPMQTSGFAIPYALHEAFRLQGHTGADALWRSLWSLRSFLQGGARTVGFPMPVYLIALAAITGNLLARRRSLSTASPLWTRALFAALALLLAAAALIFIHTFVRWYAREWYFDALVTLFAFIVGLWLAFAPPFGAVARALVAVALSAFLVASLSLGVARLRAGYWPHQVEMLRGAQWLRDNVPPGEAAVAFNAGILGYFSERRVTNLDGVVDDAAFAAIRTHALASFIRDTGARYYADYEPAMLIDYTPFLGADPDVLRQSPVAEIAPSGEPWRGSKLTIFGLEW